MKETSYFTNKRIGTLMLIGSLLAILLMLLHPHGAGDPSQNNHLKWVHGSLIFLLIFNAYGVNHFVDSLSNNNDIKLSLLCYYIGLGGFIIGAMIDGYVLSNLTNFQQTDPALYSNLTKFTLIFNQAFAKLGVISFGAAGLFLFPFINADNKLTRIVSITGCAAGVILVITMLTGMYLTITTMTILTVLIMIWHSTIGWWLFKS